MRCLLMVMTAVTFAACGPPNPNPDGGVPDGGEPVAPLVLSTLDEAGAAMPLTGDAFAIPGSQGGFHVNVTYALPEGGVGQVTFEHRVVRASDDKLVSTGTRQWDLGLIRQASWASPAPVNVFMCPTPVGIDVIDRELLFTVKAKDAMGRVLATGTARATFRCGPNAGSYCSNICKG